MAAFIGVGTPNSLPFRTTNPFNSSISVRRPRSTSWSRDGRPPARLRVPADISDSNASSPRPSAPSTKRWGAIPSGQRRDALVVHAILKIDDDPIWLAQKAAGKQGRPVGVVSLDRQKDCVERLADRLRIAQVHRIDWHQVLAAGAAQPQPVG